MPKSITVTQCRDFTPDGRGSNSEWATASWIDLSKLPGGTLTYGSRFKIMYSQKGVYVLFEGEDDKISTDYTRDQDDLYNADVFEVFFQPDTRHPIYFEYEINALGKELVILVPNIDGRFLGWQPWHYEGQRRITKAVHVEGGQQKPFAGIVQWTAEIFFPYEVLDPLIAGPPKPGDVWRGNFYRLDYDDEDQNKWSWTPVERHFHEYQRFGELIFQ